MDPESLASVDVDIRHATHDDYDGVVDIVEGLWSDRGGDYIPRIYHDWIDKERSQTYVADLGDELGCVAQVVLLGEDEAWCQGMRVHRDHRGKGLSTATNTAMFDWAADHGATVARNMVFSWNVQGLGGSRAAGFEPCTEFRWAHPDPDQDAALQPGHERLDDPALAWRGWSESDARDHLRGLGLALDESWALQEVTRDVLRRAADETAVVAIGSDEGVRAATYRVRDYTREDDETGEDERWVEYGIGAWADTDAARSLFAAIARDAASLGADRTRVLVPETVRHVSDASFVRAGISDDPDFVLAADLSGDYPVS